MTTERRPPASQAHLARWLAGLRGSENGGGVLTRQLVAAWCGTSHSTIKKIAAGYEGKMSERLQYDLSALLDGINEGRIAPREGPQGWELWWVNPTPRAESTTAPTRATIQFGAGAPSVTWGRAPTQGEQ